MPGWGDEEDYEIDDAVLDGAVTSSTSSPIAMDDDGVAQPAPESIRQQAADHHVGDPGVSAPVVALRGHRTHVAQGAELVPTAVDDATTRRARKYLDRYAPTSSPGVNRAMSGLLHEIHTLTRNGAV